MENLTKEQATQFFSEFYRGEHHIPGYGVKQWGHGFCVEHDRGGFATSDFNELTRFVLMGHDKCIRVEIEAIKKGVMRVAIWKRDPNSNSISEGHPTIDKAIESYNNNKPKS